MSEKVNFLKWGLILSFIMKLISIAQTFILARLISPVSYGIFTQANNTVSVAQSLSLRNFMESSFYSSEDLTIEERAMYLRSGILLHLGLFVIANAISLGSYLFHERIEIIIASGVLSVAILINAFRSFHNTVLRRELAWKRLRSLQIVSTIVSSVVAVGLAYFGFEIAALVTYALIVPIPFVIDLYVRDRSRTRISFGRIIGWPVVSFGLKQSGAEMLNNLRLYIESLAIIAVISVSDLGYYSRALGLAALSAGWIADQVTAIIYPILARDYRKELSTGAPGLLIRCCAWSSLPIALTLSLYSGPIIRLVFGETWLPAQGILPVIVWIVLLSSIINIVRITIQSKSGPRVWIASNAFIFVCTLVALPLLYIDLKSYLIAILVAHLILLVALVWKCVRLSLITFEPFSRLLKLCAYLCFVVAVFLQLPPPPGFSDDISSSTVFYLIAVLGGLSLFTLLGVRISDASGLRNIVTYLPARQLILRILHLRTDRP